MLIKQLAKGLQRLRNFQLSCCASQSVFFAAKEIVNQVYLRRKDTFPKTEEKYLYSRKMDQSVFIIIFIVMT